MERTSRWRTLGALKELALWWGLMLVTAFIPLLHLISVPVLFFFGAWRAYSRLSEERTLLTLHGTCPHCGTEQDFPAGGALKDSLTLDCANCRWELKLDVPPMGDAEGTSRGGATAGK